MKKKRFLLSAVLLAGVATFAYAQRAVSAEGPRAEQSAVNEKDIDLLYAQVEQAREDLAVVLRLAGVDGERGERHDREGRGEHSGRGDREGRGEHGNREGRGEHGGEGRGEHGGEGRGEHAEGRERGERGGEEGDQRMRKNQTWDATRNGARLVLAYDAKTQSFKGRVKNTTREVLSDVRVEVHLSNGVELGPTRRVDLRPGQTVEVELSAADQRFSWWTTHPEHGNEEGHGPNHEEDGDEHGGEGKGNRPSNPELRPLHNQLMLLQQELRMLRAEAERRSRD